MHVSLEDMLRLQKLLGMNRLLRPWIGLLPSNIDPATDPCQIFNILRGRRQGNNSFATKANSVEALSQIRSNPENTHSSRSSSNNPYTSAIIASVQCQFPALFFPRGEGLRLCWLLGPKARTLNSSLGLLCCTFYC